MPESRIREAIYELFESIGQNILEERIADYIIRELKTGRQLPDILEDPYVKDRIGNDHLEHVLGNKEVLKAYEERIRASLKH